MFGFIRGQRTDRQYRVLYARACQAHFTHNGRLASVFHSYEAVFLYVLAFDLGLLDPPRENDPTCCRLRRRFDISETEQQVGRFSSAFAMLLLSIKLRDDWNDDRSLTSRLGLRIFRRPIQRATSYLNSLDPNFNERLDTILAQHESLESQPSALVTLEQFQAATRVGFGYVFSLFAQRWLPADKHSTVEMIGQCLGEAIITFDCAVDWKNDQKRKRFNPLKNIQQVQQSLLDCSRSLIRAAEAIASLTTQDQSDVVCRRVLDHQIRLVLRRASTLSVELRQKDCLSKREVASGEAMIALRQGDCDICCAVGACDGCACESAACDALACNAGSSSCCDGIYCFDCCCVGSDCGPNKKKKTQNQQAGTIDQSEKNNFNALPNSERYKSLVGTKGRTSGPLNPTGLVSIDDQYYPATSWTGSYIDSETDVLVVDTDTFGLRVKEAGSSF